MPKYYNVNYDYLKYYLTIIHFSSFEVLILISLDLLCLLWALLWDLDGRNFDYNIQVLHIDIFYLYKAPYHSPRCGEFKHV